MNWIKGMPVRSTAGSAIGQSRIGHVAWIGRTKRGRLSIGVKTADFPKLIFFTPGDYNEWLPVDTKEA